MVGQCASSLVVIQSYFAASAQLTTTNGQERGQGQLHSTHSLTQYFFTNINKPVIMSTWDRHLSLILPNIYLFVYVRRDDKVDLNTGN